MAKKTSKKVVKRRKGAQVRRNRKTKKTKRKVVRSRRYDSRLEFGIRYMREGDSLAGAAKKIGVTSSRLRNYAAGTGIATRTRPGRSG